jgi:ubiquinone/menaquinone biosynthesis C-methylase UbiE
MHLSDINMKELQAVPYKSKAMRPYLKAKVKPPRRVYKDASYFYKLWEPDYNEHRIIIYDGKRIFIDTRDTCGKEMLPGFQFGLFDEKICPAFVDYIHDGNTLRGYKTLSGEPLAGFDSLDSVLTDYIAYFMQMTLTSGFVYRDLKPRNIIKLPNGSLSLIDLESPIASLSRLQLTPALRRAQLSPKLMHADYLAYVKFLVDGKTNNESIIAARKRWTIPQPFRIIPSPVRPSAAQIRLRKHHKMKSLQTKLKPQTYISEIQLPSGEVTPGHREKGNLRRRNAIVSSALILEGKRVLDVGCSLGLYSIAMARTALEVVGIDHRESKLQIGRNTAQALGLDNLTFKHGDVRDPSLLSAYGKFDLIIAWGFLHRVSDIFSLLYSLEPLADAISLEWRTPIIPLMGTASFAYHNPDAKRLDPMNISSGHEEKPVEDFEKIEGKAGFWEPTAGAVKAIMRRLGFKDARLLGYGESLVSEDDAMHLWYRHLRSTAAGTESLDRVPRSRVHMLFEKRPGSILLRPFKDAEALLPAWDVAWRRKFSK